MTFGFSSRLDKIMYGVLVLGMFAIGAGGAYLRFVQQRIIDTQVQRAQQISDIIETQKIRAKQIEALKETQAQIIETQKAREQQIQNIKEFEALQDKKLDEILGILKRQRP